MIIYVYSRLCKSAIFCNSFIFCWQTYGRSSKKVKTKCIENAYNMTFTLVIKNGPASNDLGQYVKLKIVAKEQKEDEGKIISF